MNTNRFFEDQLSNKIIGCALIVSNTLGVGSLEKVYENALAHALREAGLTVDRQYPTTIHYDGVTIGSYAADLLIDKTVLVELKAVTALNTIHRAQCINYLKGSGLRLCPLLNFGSPRLEIKRVFNDA
jgi:GxxExxY protein